MTDSTTRLPLDPLGKPLMGYDFDFEMCKVAVYIDDGAGGVALWDGVVDIDVTGSFYVYVDDLEQYILDQLAQYQYTGFLEDGTDTYIGYEDKDGNYYIEKYPDTGLVTFAVGTGGIPATGTWTGLSYGTFASKF